MICFAQVVVLSIYFKNFLKQIIRVYSTILISYYFMVLDRYGEGLLNLGTLRVAIRYNQLGLTNNDDTK